MKADLEKLGEAGPLHGRAPGLARKKKKKASLPNGAPTPATSTTWTRRPGTPPKIVTKGKTPGPLDGPLRKRGRSRCEGRRVPHRNGVVPRAPPI